MQTLPLARRKKIMWLLVAMCTVLIIFGWLFWIKYTARWQVEKPASPNVVSDSIKKIKEAVPNIKEEVGFAWESLNGQ